jgi:SagB-type dehydrogenase family enzyme
MASRTEARIDPADALLRYHERSKHRLRRYADGPGGLDWANQPDPFREFDGAPRLRLPLAADTLATRYNDIRRGALPSSRAFDFDSIAILLELSLGLSAWKQYGSTRWALRCNPSSGNLHPTEGYVVCPSVDGLDAGIYHYVSRDHALECRASVGDARWRGAFRGLGILVGLTSIHWREAWKYGMRAWRYCQHDCGHAMAALSYAAAALGWQCRWLASASDAAIATLLGLDRNVDFESAEREAPDALLWIGEPGAEPDVSTLASLARGAAWTGRANRLSAEHVHWPDIDSIDRATLGRGTVTSAPPASPALPEPRPTLIDLTFATIARQRRSAVDFDGRTSIAASTFEAMLDCLMPRPNTPPWNVLAEPARVHPALFVHRVDGLDPGLYLLARNAGDIASLRAAMRSEWLWERAGASQLPLYRLLPLDLRAAARTICCHQDIAADSCFALGMMSRLADAIDEPWRYRVLYWECGMLGHVLYLEAEAARIRGTGIGCFFDDEMHGLLGVRDSAWQSLYHFTAGGAIEDRRLTTLPPYPPER